MRLTPGLASLSVDGTHSAYGYDPQGNMTRDGAWNLDLEYNMIDRAQNVKQDGVTLADYSYLWDGTKLSTLKGDGTGLVYLGSLVYKKSGTTLSAESIAFSGGRIAAATAGTTTTYTPNYHVTDHLGSVRVVVDGNGTVLERSDYYPYGLRWDNAALTAPANRYRYNGKEEQAFAGLPYIDYGARQYDPKFRLAWNGVDPMAHKYYPVGPYAFCGNNPIRFMDPDGRKIVDAKGNVLYDNGWTKAAENTDAKRVGDAMRKTNIGRNIWDKMAAAEYGITIRIDPGNGPVNEMGRADIYMRGEEVVKVGITIYQESINQQVDPENTNDQANLFRPMSNDDRIGTVGVHEGTHAIDETPRTVDRSSNSPRETNARTAHTQHARELERQTSVINPATNIFPKTPLRLP